MSPQKPPPYEEERHEADSSKAIINRRAAVISGNMIEVSVYDRELLKGGNVVNGPAIIVEYSATTLIPPGFTCRIDEYGNLLLSF